MIGRRLWAGLLLAASIVVASAQHHEDLGLPLAVRVAGSDRFVTDHSPFSKGTHWHNGTRVKDDPCLACQSQRLSGLAADPCREAPLAIEFFAAEVLVSTPLLGTLLSNGSRAPPALL